MDEAFFRCMGHRNSDRGLSFRFLKHATRKIPHVQSPPLCSEGSSLCTMYRKVGAIRGNQSSTNQREILRFLLEPIYSTKEGRFSQTCARPQGSQQIHPISTVQDGNVEICHSRDGTGATDDVPGHKGRIPACSNLAPPSPLPTICLPEQTLSICGSPIRIVVRSQGFHQVDGGDSCNVETAGDFRDPLSGRPPVKGQFRIEGQGASKPSSSATPEFRMDHQLVEVQPRSQSQDDIPRPGIRYDHTDCNITHGQAGQDQRSSSTSSVQSKHDSTQGDASTGNNGFSHRGSSICANTSSVSPSQHSNNVERGTSIPPHVLVTSGEGGITVVDEIGESSCRSIVGNTGVDCDINRRQPPGLGGNMGRAVCPRALVSRGSQTTNKYSRAESGKIGPRPVDRPIQRKAHTRPKRQCYDSSVHKSSRRDTKSGGPGRSQTDSSLGGKQLSEIICNTHSRSVQHKSGLSQSESAGSRRMGTASRGVQSADRPVGNPHNRLNGFQKQSKSTKILCPPQGSVSSGGGCHDSELALQSSICLPTSSNATKGPQKDKAISVDSHCSGTVLAPEDLVHRPAGDVNRTADPAGQQTRSPPAGTHITSQSRTLRFDGMAVERSIWRRQGLNEEVILTMIKARKASSSKSYHRVWQSYLNWCKESHFPFLELQLPRILSFLQRGLQLGLKLRSLKVQVSALSILFQSRLANEDLIRTFLQGVAHIVPPFRTPVAGWDLNVVLEALLDPPFEPLS
ncbi:uncharacterized protein LOC121400624 [Xenopus laevis]|uniref:Uncharacterized protein LOC121400624 n=1 Tax=Xenopus laevis TaxID=8355 RepID=A0A8J1MF16_XENLA|nr:uncharacterized protein LOC121400624 [Xenopus laevis]